MENLKKDRNIIKLFGALAMTLDHIAIVFFVGYDLQSLISAPLETRTLGILFRLIGRLAFPIFCFFLVEGYLLTRNKARYFLRLTICAIVAEVPFDLCLSSSAIDFSHQNTVFTLMLGLIAITCIEKANKLEDNRLLVQILAFIVCSAAASLLNFDYGWGGIAFIVVLYLFRSNNKLRIIFSAFILLFCGLGEVIGVISIIIANKYNQNMYRLKYFFYVFYPLHLLLLHIIRLYVVK